MSVERCGWSDLPIESCDHCPPDVRETARKVAASRTKTGTHAHVDVIAMRENEFLRVVPLWPEVEPGDERPVLNLYAKPSVNAERTCACGVPLAGAATACRSCVGELERILGDVPWMVEQLEVAITGQRAKSGAGRGDDGLPWNDAASTALAALTERLTLTLGLITPSGDEKRHDHKLRAETMSRRLLANLDTLAHHNAWTETLRSLRSIEGRTLAIIDNPPALAFLGYCKAERVEGSDLTLRVEVCDEPLYAREEDLEVRCRACGATYDVDTSRQALIDALDDQLYTAIDLAKLAEVGFWDRLPTGYAFHEWDERQPTASDEKLAREAQGKSGAIGNHRRWHIAKNVINPDCTYCQEADR